MCVTQTMCFLTLLLGALGQSVFTYGVTATAAQTAEVSLCGNPVTESDKDHTDRDTVEESREITWSENTSDT